MPGVEKLSNFFKPMSYLNNIKSCFEANNNSSSQWHKTLGGRRELLGLLNVLTGEILNDKDWTIWSSWLYLSQFYFFLGVYQKSSLQISESTITGWGPNFNLKRTGYPYSIFFLIALCSQSILFLSLHIIGISKIMLRW